jgi:hypothetical protein
MPGIEPTIHNVVKKPLLSCLDHVGEKRYNGGLNGGLNGPSELKLYWSFTIDKI